MENQHYFSIRLCVLSIVPFLVLTGIFWGYLGYNIPPFNAAYPTADLVQHFTENSVRLRAAYAVAIPTWSLLFVWSIGIFFIMRRIEGSAGPLSYIQLIGGSLTALVPSIASVFWLTAAFRPETDAANIQMLYDLGWLTIDMAFGVTTLQYVAAGIVFIRDKRSKPLIPQWVAWLGILIGLEFVLEFFMPYFRSGPFSWGGLFNYWLPFFGPFSWMAILSYYMIKAIKRLEQEDQQ